MKLTITSDSPIGRNRRASQAFTLVELMVSVSILVILMLVVANFVNLVQHLGEDKLECVPVSRGKAGF